jgi:hypothetical protein
MFGRAPKQKKSDFERRQFCSRFCSNHAHIAKATAKRRELWEDLLANRQTCVVCGNPFKPRIGERLWDYRKRVTCNPVCAALRIGDIHRARHETLPLDEEGPRKPAREEKIAAMFAAIGRDYAPDDCPIAKADFGSIGDDYKRNRLVDFHGSLTGNSGAMCAL